MSIRIADLARESVTIEGHTFEDCNIYGPAVVFPGHEVNIADCAFESDLRGFPDNIFIVIKEDRKLYGVIGLKECTFRRCTFHRIAIVCNPAFKEAFRAAIRSKQQ